VKIRTKLPVKLGGECPHCGELFPRNSSSQMFCSEDCKIVHTAMRNDRREEERKKECTCDGTDAGDMNCPYRE
jgi:hypothetical protein